MLSQTLLLGRWTQPVQDGLRSLADHRLLARLWEQDASLWSADPATQSSIRQRLGWLTIPQVMAGQISLLRQVTSALRAEGLTHAVVLGMGGSGLFPEVCRNTFGVAPNHLDLAVLDSTDPTAIRSCQARGPLERLLVIVSSKSGSTSEISALSKYFYDTLKGIRGGPGGHCVAITDQGSPLETQARAWNFRHIMAHGPQTGADVGGRFSAMTYFGLLPALLLGIDAECLLARACEMLARCGPRAPITDNPAAQLGAVLGTLVATGRDKLTLLCPQTLTSFGTWVEQLVAESTGKMGKGVVPICGEPLREPSAYGPDRMFVELQLRSEPDATLERHVRALAEAGQPVVRVQWEDRYDLGGEVIKWELATTIAGSLMGINPFDEPNVQESKDRTKALLSQYTRDRRFASDTPLWADDDLALYGTSLRAVRSLAQVLAEWLEGGRSSDYLAILSFLPRTASLDAVVQAIRMRLSTRVGSATMVGVGPRYLHSTGQLYKGGADAGRFLLLTADERADIPIPDEPFTFGVLKQAQALGDFQAMQSRGRRILRVHLCGAVEQAAHQLLNTIDTALTSVARH